MWGGRLALKGSAHLCDDGSRLDRYEQLAVQHVDGKYRFSDQCCACLYLFCLPLLDPRRRATDDDAPFAASRSQLADAAVLSITKFRCSAVAGA